MARLLVLLFCLLGLSPGPVRAWTGDLPPPGRVDPRGCDPDYPPGALERGETGTVVLALLVDRGGTVRDGTVARSSSFPDLDAGTLDAFSRCRVFPHMDDGEPVTAWLTIVVHWVLVEDDPPLRQAGHFPLTRLAG